MENKKTGIVVLFTGIRGTEIPLLYYTSKLYEDIGYEKVLVSCQMSDKSEFETVYNRVKEEVEKIDFTQYEQTIFIGKSIGTLISSKLKEELNISAKLILLTPLEQTLPYIRHDNDIILVAAGNQDNFLESKKLVERCEAAKVNYHIENGVGHRMEVRGDINKCLEVVGNVIKQIISVK